jgi:hypothetical protein
MFRVDEDLRATAASTRNQKGLLEWKSFKYEDAL